MYHRLTMDEQDLPNENDVHEAALFYLGDADLLDLKPSHRVEMTHHGLVYFEDVLDRLIQLGLKSISKRKFQDYVEEEWDRSAEMGAQLLGDEGDFSASPDCTYVRKGQNEYTLPGRPAKIVARLLLGRRSGFPDVATQELLNCLGGSYLRIRHAFRPNHIDAWGDLVTSRGRGSYRLKL